MFFFNIITDKLRRFRAYFIRYLLTVFFMYNYTFLLLNSMTLGFIDNIRLSMAFLNFSLNTDRLGAMFTVQFGKCLALLFVCLFANLISDFNTYFFVDSLTVTVIHLNTALMLYSFTFLIKNFDTFFLMSNFTLSIFGINAKFMMFFTALLFLCLNA